MLFNSLEFAVFLPVVFIIYWFVFNKNLKLQNLFLIMVSYLFYGWWDWRFLSLIIVSSLADFSIGQLLARTDKKERRKMLLWTSISINIGLLGIFKYYNFFVDSFVEAFSFFGQELHLNSLRIILPVGISFYTFQTMSYTIDIFRNKLEPTKDILSFFAFVSFFPQLVAGPIERASNLLPQFLEKRSFSYQQGSDGVKLILWGLFKKIVIADNAAVMVNEIFSNYGSLSVIELLAGAFYFALQIYGDFSGYSDIAIGTARLLGFKLMVNFRVPYFSRDIAEFWRRWHISLSTWFRDYLYIPLGGSRCSKWLNVRNIMIIFLVSGFWHGANWTFIIWGFLNGLYFLPLMLAKSNRKNLDTVAESKFFPSLKEVLQISMTFGLTCLAWVFFRAESVGHAFDYFGALLSNQWLPKDMYYFPPFFFIVFLVFFLLEWMVFRDEKFLSKIEKQPDIIRYSGYFTLLFFILFFAPNQSQSFIYFQF